MPIFSLCHNNIESHLHTIQDCLMVKELWRLIKLQFVSRFFEVSDWREWLMINIMDTFLCNDIPLCVMFGVVLENIWWRWNQVVFQACIMDNLICFIRSKGLVQALIPHLIKLHFLLRN